MVLYVVRVHDYSVNRKKRVFLKLENIPRYYLNWKNKIDLFSLFPAEGAYAGDTIVTMGRDLILFYDDSHNGRY